MAAQRSVIELEAQNAELLAAARMAVQALTAALIDSDDPDRPYEEAKAEAMGHSAVVHLLRVIRDVEEAAHG